MMSESRQYESDPQRDVAVTTSVHAGVRVAYATARSYGNLMAGQPAQNYLTWRANDRKAVFAICDGQDSPFAGQLAARFLGERLLEWLWTLPDDSDTPQDELKVRLAYQLNAWAQPAQDQVLSYPLPDGLSDKEREEQENLRRSQGSEAFFACGRLDYSLDRQPQALFAWAGETFLRCISADGVPIQFDPVRSPANRWSSVFGLRGSLSIAQLGDEFAVQRILAFSPALAALEPDLADLSPRAIQGLIQECFLKRAGGDLAFLDLQILPRSLGEEAESGDITDFREVLSEILLKYQFTRDHTGFLEWSFPAGAVYAVLEERNTDGIQRPVYAGPATHWVVPEDRAGCQYRVCVYSPGGQSWSDWVDLVAKDEAQPLEAPVGPEEQIEPAFSTEPEAVEPGQPPDLEPSPAATDEPLTWPKERPEANPPSSFQPLDWENWQPKYYGETAGQPTSEPLVPVTETGNLTVLIEARPTADENEAAEPAHEHSTLPEPETGSAEAKPVPALDKPAQKAEEISERSEEQPVFGSEAAGWMNFRSRRGAQPGEYILEWDPVSQVRDYEIKAHFGNKDRLHVVSGTRDILKGLEPGRHYFRIRPIYPGPRSEWDENNLTVIDAPERIQKAPGSLTLEINPDHTFTLQWTFPAGEIVEEYCVYDLTGRKPELMMRLPPETSRCQITPPGLEERRKYSVRAANWSGLGPESRPAVYDPPGVQVQPDILKRLMGLFQAPAAAPADRKGEKPEDEEVITCTTFYDLCEEVTRYVKRHGIHMERIRLEQRVGSEENYIPVDSRRTTELVSLNFTKGPDHRLFVFGTRGEVVTALITFDKIRWNMNVRFKLMKKA